MKLIIAEKPSVAKQIADVIGAYSRKEGFIEGNNYIISWCIGHLVELASADKYDEKYLKWKYEDLPIIPEKWNHIVSQGTKGQFNILKKLLDDTRVDEVICATDAGREGELIFRLVYEKARCNKIVKRLWISSMEESSIREGLNNLKDSSIYDDLYESALARSKADWLVGINATRLFSVLYHNKLNIGRVQTPTLAMITTREENIKSFNKEKYYLVHLKSEKIDGISAKISSKEEAEKIVVACEDAQAFISVIESEMKNINPPKLYDLTTLQREANRIFGYTAKQTLDYTQSLYEKKLVTYPRTDSQYLTENMEESTLKIIELITKNIKFAEGLEMKPDIKKILNSKKVSDHHAVIPTSEIGKSDLTVLPSGESNILNLVSNKLLCAASMKHTFESVTVKIKCNENVFELKGKTIKDNGWKLVNELFRQSLKEKNQECEEYIVLPRLEKEQIIENKKFEISEHYTSPPKHYTEDTLLAAMEKAGNEDLDEDTEKRGLGTPATRAGIIEKLIKSNFIERKNKQIIHTESGMKLISVIPENIKSPKMTAEWEMALTKIAKGEENASDFMKKIEVLVSELVDNNSEANEAFVSIFQKESEVIGTCPRCKSNVYEMTKSFSCENEECSFILWKENKFFKDKKKTITKKIAEELLKNGKTKVKGLYSEKKDSTYDAIVVLDDTGEKYVNFKIEFGEKR